MLLDHIGIDISDLARARAFYDRALAPLGIAVIIEAPGGVAVGYGETADDGDIQAGKQSFWLVAGENPGGHMHVAFEAKTREQVEAFHREALAAGGTDNGGPGLRPHYGPNYYAAFVLDPDGHNIEAVCNH